MCALSTGKCFRRFTTEGQTFPRAWSRRRRASCQRALPLKIPPPPHPQRHTHTQTPNTQHTATAPSCHLRTPTSTRLTTNGIKTACISSLTIYTHLHVPSLSTHICTCLHYLHTSARPHTCLYTHVFIYTYASPHIPMRTKRDNIGAPLTGLIPEVNISAVGPCSSPHKPDGADTQLYLEI